MISAAAIGAELVSLGVIGGGLYLFLRTNPSSSAPLADSSPSDPHAVPQFGIVGLSAAGKSQPDTDPPTPKPVEPMRNLDTVGASVDTYRPEAEKELTRSLEDELLWASGELSFLSGYGATVMTDPLGKVCWADGPLIANTSDLSDCARSMMDSGKGEVVVLNLRRAEVLPFLTVEAKSAAIVPIGDDGAALVVASTDEEDCFGPIERRTITAVRSRLLAFKLAAARVRVLTETTS